MMILLQTRDFTLFGCFKTATFPVIVQVQSRNLFRFAIFIYGYHSEITAIGMAYRSFLNILRFYTNPDFHRDATNMVDTGQESYQLTHMNWFLKVYLVYR